jgi:aryl-alcohol dehydrogenase-like predicted oxidoreductase
VVFGSMGLGQPGRDPQARLAALHAALDAGVTSIDTAPLYGFGRCEEVLGEALGGMRQRVELLTKVGLRWDDPRGEVLFRFRDAAGREQAVRRNSRPDSVRTEVERSLRRLRTDVLDLVQVHHPDPHTPIADTLGALAELQREGKLRAIGVSNYDAEQLREAQAALGALPLASDQVHYSLLERWPEREILPTARRLEIGVLAYSPVGQGLLGGRADARPLAADDSRHADARFSVTNRARITATIRASLEPAARAHAATVAQVALAWLLAQPGLSAVIVGASSAEQALENARASEIVLNDCELRTIDAAFAVLRLEAPPRAPLWRRAERRLRGLVRALLR